MTMSMSLSLGPRLRQYMECRCCRQALDSERQQDTLVVAALFGARKYAICPSCRQEVEDHQDKNYRARVRRFARRSGLYTEEISVYTPAEGEP